ncbi:MAG: hypothetical protein Q8N65_00820 [bacterium]|nr:hypothetical protein [bacterium]
MKKIIPLLIVLILALILLSFLLMGKLEFLKPGPASEARDSQGCLAATESWCETKQKCLRAGEENCEGSSVDERIPTPQPRSRN